jgi:hypothetical protein
LMHASVIINATGPDLHARGKTFLALLALSAAS